MNYDGELAAGKIVRVIGDLIVDVKDANDKEEPAFCGAVEIAEMCKPEMQVLLVKAKNNQKIIKKNVLFVKTDEGWILADPKYNRSLFKEAFSRKQMPDFKEYNSYRSLKAEEAGGIDFELSGENDEKAFVFVTSIYHKKDGYATFPQKINFFEIKMLEALHQKIANGAKGYIMMIAPREDCTKAKFVWDIDPTAAAAMYDAKQNGVNFVCYGCKIEDDGISLGDKMEISF